MPERIIKLIPPQPVDYDRHRELFPTKTQLFFDPLTAAEVGASNTLRLLLNDARLARIVEQSARFPKEQMSLSDYLMKVKTTIRAKSQQISPLSKMHQEIAFSTEKLFFNRLLQIAADKKGSTQVVAEAMYFLDSYFYDDKASKMSSDKDMKKNAHNRYLQNLLQSFRNNPNDFKAPPPPIVPPGQPIGCDFGD